MMKRELDYVKGTSMIRNFVLWTNHNEKIVQLRKETSMMKRELDYGTRKTLFPYEKNETSMMIKGSSFTKRSFYDEK